MEIKFDTITFFSNFNSGNLGKVEKVPVQPINNSEDFCDVEFNVWTKPDAYGTEHENLNRTWFYFGISGVPLSHNVKINIVNLNKQGKLYSQGYAPLYKTVPSVKEKWERIKEKITYDQNNSELTLSFIHTFNIPNSTTYFAFAYPWSYLECQEKLEYFDEVYKYCKNSEQNRIHQKSVYYYRELLCSSREGCRVDLITVSDCHGISRTSEARFDDNLFPEVNKPRCKEFPMKKVFFLTSRVHPGETPSSHVFNGFLDFLLRENDARAEQLRRTYVFKLIPMLNPDGVTRGHYRTDDVGVNLNRVYLDPTFKLYPSIYAAKSLLVYYHSKNTPLWPHIFEKFKTKNKIQEKEATEGLPGVSKSVTPQTVLDECLSETQDKRPVSFFLDFTESDNAINTTPHLCDPQLLDIPSKDSGVAFYIDLHAHASKKGCFFYGNYFTDLESQIECLTYAKLVSLNSAHFDFGNCNFTEKNMYAHDKKEKSTKEGSGRVAIHKHLGIVHCYTLECNYNTGKIVNHVPSSTGRVTPPLPPGTAPQKYTVAHFEEVGRALGVAALDITDSNPWSRITQSEFNNSNGVRDYIRKTHPLLKSHPANKTTTSTSLQQLSSSATGHQCVAATSRSCSVPKSNQKFSISASPPEKSTSQKPSRKQSPGNKKSSNSLHYVNNCLHTHAKSKSSKQSGIK